MTMGIVGRTRLISVARTDPSNKSSWCSSTTASTGRDINNRRPSGALVALINWYPFSSSNPSWTGSRCMHNNVRLIPMRIRYTGSLPANLVTIAQSRRRWEAQAGTIRASHKPTEEPYLHFRP